MILRLLCIWLVFYSLYSSLMHGTMNRKCTFIIYVCLFDNVPGGKVVSILTRIWAGGSVVRIPAMEKRPHRLWGPRSPLFFVYRGYLPGVKRLGRELNQSSSLSIEVTNEWSYTSVLLVCFNSADRENVLTFYTFLVSYIN
jgi:hypothetical protein